MATSKIDWKVVAAHLKEVFPPSWIENESINTGVPEIEIMKASKRGLKVAANITKAYALEQARDKSNALAASVDWAAFHEQLNKDMGHRDECKCAIKAFAGSLRTLLFTVEPTKSQKLLDRIILKAKTNV